MDLPTIHFLTDQIRLTHRCDCEFVAAVRVEHAYKGRVLWRGRVGVFRLHLCSEFVECFAWTRDELQGAFTPVILLRTRTIDCPTAAVKAHLMQLCPDLHAA